MAGLHAVGPAGSTVAVRQIAVEHDSFNAHTRTEEVADGLTGGDDGALRIRHDQVGRTWRRVEFGIADQRLQLFKGLAENFRSFRHAFLSGCAR